MQILPVCPAVRNARLQNRKLASYAGRHLRVTPDRIAVAERPAAMAWSWLFARVNNCKGGL